MERAGALPNLIVIGAQKCGTTALHSYLSLHPEISMSQIKELDFFIEEREWNRGVEWYSSQFDPSAPVRGEASPDYTSRTEHKGVAERMHQLVPDAKLIFTVRDPIARIEAHWMHEQATGIPPRDLRASLLAPGATYVDRSRYAYQLEPFLELFPRDQLLIVEQDDLRHRRAETLSAVYRFLGVDPDFTHPSYRREWHRSRRKTRPTRLGKLMESIRRRGGRRVLPPVFWSTLRGWWPMGLRIRRPDVWPVLPAEVVEALREDARRFEDIAGRRFSHWSLWTGPNETRR